MGVEPTQRARLHSTGAATESLLKLRVGGGARYLTDL